MTLKRNKPRFFSSTTFDKENRPVIRPEMAPVDWLLEGFALTGLLVMIAFAANQFSHLPESIPSHFNAAGKPDDYSSRDSLWFLPLIALFLFGLMTYVSRIPHKFNYPIPISPQNAARQYAMAVRLIRTLKAVIMWLFATITIFTVRTALGSSTGLGLWFMPVFLTMVFGPLITYLVLAFRKK